MGQKWVVVPAVILLMFFFFFLPGIISKLEDRFHKKALMLLSTGRAKEVLELARKQILLSVFGDSAPVDAKIGLAYAQTGEFQLAAQYLETAIPHAPQAEKTALQAAFIKSLFVIGEPARAEAEAHKLLETGGPRLPEILIIYARCRLAVGKRDERTKAALDEAAALSLNNDTALMLALANIEYNMAIGKKALDVPGDADSPQRFLRVWKHMVTGRQREQRGKSDDAVLAYKKAVKEGGDEGCWFADIAHMRIEMLTKSNGAAAGQGSSDSRKKQEKAAPVDPVLRKKKKKRR
jgi:tetratricopeptide (TPR) repeat protein